jgi:hypothetical protein
MSKDITTQQPGEKGPPTHPAYTAEGAPPRCDGFVTHNGHVSDVWMVFRDD